MIASGSSPKTLTGAIRISCMIVLVAVLVAAVSSFVSAAYDWDVDHEIYFGSRLLQGELIWTKEFHDKLPFVQIVFSIPAYFQSINVWRAMSLISVICAALVMRMTLAVLMGSAGTLKP